MARPSYQLFTTDNDLLTKGSRRITAESVAASSTDTYYSNQFPSRDGMLGFTVTTSGTLTGTFTLWYSNKENPSVADDTDWDQNEEWTPTNPAGGVTKEVYAVTDMPVKWARLKYVNASGTGNLQGEAQV